MSEETENTSGVRDQTKELSKRLWEETMRKRTIGRPAKALQEANIRAGELMDSGGYEGALGYQGFQEGVAALQEGAGEVLAAGAAMTGLKSAATAEPATDFYIQEGPGKPTGFTAKPGDHQYEAARDVGQRDLRHGRGGPEWQKNELLRQLRYSAAELRDPVTSEAKAEKHGRAGEALHHERNVRAEAMERYKSLVKRLHRDFGMTTTEVRNILDADTREHRAWQQKNRGRPATEFFSDLFGGKYPQHMGQELAFERSSGPIRHIPPARPMGAYHAEALAEPPQVETEPPRQYDPLAKERTAAGRDISYLRGTDLGLDPEERLKGTRGGQMTTPAVSQAEPDVVEQMGKGERKGKADPRFRGGTVPESTTSGGRSAYAGWLGERFPTPVSPPTNVPPHTKWGRGAVGLDGSALTPEVFDEMVKQNRYDYTQRERFPKDLYTRILQQRRQNLKGLAASQAAYDQSRSLDEQPERFRRAQSAQQRLNAPPSYSNTMEDLARVEQELAELLAEPKARGEEASKKAAGKKTRTYKGTGKPKPGIESLPSRQGMEARLVRTYPESGGRPGLFERSPAATVGLAAMAIPLLIAGGEGLKSLLGKPEGDEIFIEMSRLHGDPLPKGYLNDEAMESFKSRPNDVARLLQAGIFSAELARELAPSRIKGRKQAVENAMNKERK